MKTLFRRTLHILLLLVVLSFPLMAQQVDAGGADLLRSKIEQLENADITSKSKTVQDIYKQTLARLYRECLANLNGDVADLRKIQAAAQSDPQGDIASQIAKLTNEMNVTAEKL